MRLVPTNCIKDDSVLAKDIIGGDGRPLLRKGVLLNPALVKRIEDSGVFTVYINDEYSTNEIEDILKPQLRNTAIKYTKETFNHFSKYGSQLKENNKTSQGKQIEKTREKHLDSLNNISKDIVEEILYNKNVMINLVDIKSLDNYTYQHSVNVAVLALVLGIELNLGKNDLYDLCIGAMLHDLGKTFIPKELILKKTELTDEEFEIIKTHTTKGYEYLKEQYSLPTAAKLIALQHHERLDASGYPGGQGENKINRLSKIVAIADVYDAMTSDTPYRKALPPHEAMEFMMGGAGRLFDFKMVQTFVRKIIPYPVGSLVKLSNGDVGVVEEVKPDFPLRPRVKIIRQSAINIVMVEVDLMKEKNLVIEGIQFEAPNVSVPKYLNKRIDE